MHIATKVLELSFLLLHEVLPGGNDHRLLSTVLMHLGLDALGGLLLCGTFVSPVQWHH